MSVPGSASSVRQVIPRREGEPGSMSFNSTGSAASVGADQDSELDFPAGTYYILVDNIGTGIVEGVVSCRFEERP